MELEEWRPVVGWEGLYEVSDLGRVRSVERKITQRNGVVITARAQERKSHPVEGGYLRLTLVRDSSRQTVSVHHLVLEAFVGPRPEGLESRHLDGDSARNVLTNLKWGTHSENTLDQVRHGTHLQASKDFCKRDHEFTEANTRTFEVVRGGVVRQGRSCRKCANGQRGRDKEMASG